MPTQHYYGTKRVTAWPQNKDPALIASPEGYAVMYEDGYTSWSPKDVFEKAYQPITAMSFGHAIAALKAGERVARAGWNGASMFIFLNKGSVPPQFQDHSINGVASPLFDTGEDDTLVRMPNINMRTANGFIVTGWLASQTDMLADDWMIVD